MGIFRAVFSSEQRRIAERVRATLADPPVSGWVPEAPVPPGVAGPPVGPRPSERAGAGHRHSAGRAGARLRLDPGRRSALAVGVVVVLVAVLAAGWLVVNRPRSAVVVPATARGPATGGASGGSVGARPGAAATAGPTGSAPAPGSSPAATVVVDVVGKVRSPGVYRLPLGSRVDDVLRAAGGALPDVDLSALNLARKVNDGELVAVGIPPPPVAAGGPASGTPSGPVDLNAATVAELDALPGVGPVLAQHIVEWRQAHGPFQSVEQLRQVSGIGASKFDDLRPLVTV